MLESPCAISDAGEDKASLITAVEQNVWIIPTSAVPLGGSLKNVGACFTGFVTFQHDVIGTSNQIAPGDARQSC